VAKYHINNRYFYHRFFYGLKNNPIYPPHQHQQKSSCPSFNPLNPVFNDKTLSTDQLGYHGMAKYHINNMVIFTTAFFTDLKTTQSIHPINPPTKIILSIL
jgi:hypothetical protein